MRMQTFRVRSDSVPQHLTLSSMPVTSGVLRSCIHSLHICQLASLKVDAVFAGCEVGDEGAVMLADALKATSALDTLELLSCGIGAAGAASLARAVDESNFNLLQLSLRGALVSATSSLSNRSIEQRSGSAEPCNK